MLFRREGAVGRQLGLDLIEVRLTDHGGHLPDKEPSVGRLWHGRAVSPADRVRCRAAMDRCAVLRALRIDLGHHQWGDRTERPPPSELLSSKAIAAR